MPLQSYYEEKRFTILRHSDAMVTSAIQIFQTNWQNHTFSKSKTCISHGTENTSANINLSSLFNKWIFAFLWGLFNSHNEWSRDPTHNSSTSFFCFHSSLPSVLTTRAIHLLPLQVGCTFRRADEHSKHVRRLGGSPRRRKAQPPTAFPRRALPSPLSHAATFSRLLLWNNHPSHRHMEKLQTLSNFILLAAFT